MPEGQSRFGALLRDRYRIERELGQGGMAIVYLAMDLKHQRRVAIKALRPELAVALGTGRFAHEIGVTAQLVHPHILPLLDSGEADGIPYYVTPYIEGQSLRDRLTESGPLPVTEALGIVEQIATALDYAHRHGIVHRDIKPENVLLHDGQALVADFGIALAVASAGASRLTGTGIAIGTPAYMSPEQLTGDSTLDHRSDGYALGAMLYEMLSGTTPFPAATPQAMIARRMTEPVPRIRQFRADIPAAIEHAIVRAMARSPAERFDTGAAFVAACRPAAPAGRRRPLALLLAALVLAALAVGIPLWMRLQHQRALLALPEIQRLADQRRFPEAFDLLAGTSRRLPGDTSLARLLPIVSDQITVMSNPLGASVTLQRFEPDPSGRFPAPVPAGTTPLVKVRVPRGDYRVVVSKPGFTPGERIASSELLRSEFHFAPDSVIRLTATLEPEDGARDMVPVPGGEYHLVSPDAPRGASATLGNYYLDRREVSNADYQGFIRAGGYSKSPGWPAPADEPARRAVLVDRTKLPGPRDWNDQEFPSGKADHPVTDVSWSEATAYCAFRGKRLPTIYEWEKAARNGLTVHQSQWVMPWGVATARTPATFRANLAGTRTMPVGSFPFGLSPFGAYDMAGNASEWTRTRAGRAHVTTGGSYRDPVYLFAQYGFLPADFSSPTLGFRCAKSAGAEAPEPPDPPLDVALRTPVYPVTSDARFAELRRYYDYDHRALDAHQIGRFDRPDWIQERIRYAGVGGDSVLADLFLPRGVSPPFQTIVYVPGNNAFVANPLPTEVEWVLGPHIKAGRAVLAVTLRGMIGREWPPSHVRPAPSSIQFRDEMVLHATELRLGLDYLETRSDIDQKRLAYVGMSWGAGSRLLFAALDDRFRTVVLIGGGIDERMQPAIAEANNINFAPHIRVPVLMVNGKNDEEHPWLGRALPLWALLREPKKLVLVDAAGHLPPAEARVPAINEWLDHQFGPVRH